MTEEQYGDIVDLLHRILAAVSEPPKATDSKFEAFWRAFPPGRKKSKAHAKTAFVNALAKAPIERIMAAVHEYAASEEGQGKWVKMPATWLNAECWDDDRAAWGGVLAEPEPKIRGLKEEMAYLQRHGFSRSTS